MWFAAYTFLVLFVLMSVFEYDKDVAGHKDMEIYYYADPKDFYHKNTTYVKKGTVPYQDSNIIIANTHGLPAITGRDESEFQSTTSAIYADIVNVSNQTLYDIEIGVKVYDDGNLADSNNHERGEYTFLWKSSLGPLESSITKYVPEITNWDCYEIFVKSYATKDEIVYDGDLFYQLELEITEFRDDNGKYTIGIKNKSERPIHEAFVIVVKRDSQNHVIGENIIPIKGMGSGAAKKEFVTAYIDNFQFKRTLDIWKYKKPATINVFAIGWEFNTRFPGIPYLSSYEDKKFEVLPSVLSEFRSRFYHTDSLTMSHLEGTDYHAKASNFIGDCDSVQGGKEKRYLSKFSPSERENRNLETIIPSRFKLAVDDWINNKMPENHLAEEIRYLVQKNILKVDKQKHNYKVDKSFKYEDLPVQTNSTCIQNECYSNRLFSKKESHIPPWIKKVSSWWRDEIISTRTYIEMLEFLVNHDKIKL